MAPPRIHSKEFMRDVVGPRYRDDLTVTGKQLADEYGMHEVTMTSWCRRHNFYRNGPREQPDAAETAGPAPDRAAQVGFDFDPDDLTGSRRRALVQMANAAREGRIPDHNGLGRAVLNMDRLNGSRLVEPTHEDAGQDSATPITLRPSQQPPDGPWSTWLFLGGRGAGKTLAGASWLAGQAEKVGRLALVGATLHDVREVMIGGPSGLASLPRWRGRDRPAYEPSRRRLTFPNGARAWAFSAEDADSLRGPQFAAAWADEFCAWSRPEEVLAMLRLGLRLGDDPRLVVTTTPRPIPALAALRAEPGCAHTHAPTRENLEHLAPGFLERLKALYGGTRREAQEMEGLVVEPEGGLFRAEDLARARTDAAAAPARFDRVVVAVDPTTTPGGDACGIVAVGRAGERAYVLADRSRRGLSPDAWARRAVAAMDEFGAQAIVAEVNQGGDMVAHTLRTQRPGVRVREVRAVKGKRMRAEPVAAMYEQGRIAHLGVFRELEEELMAVGCDDAGSLDRADALVWAITDLMLAPRGEGPRIQFL